MTQVLSYPGFKGLSVKQCHFLNLPDWLMLVLIPIFTHLVITPTHIPILMNSKYQDIYHVSQRSLKVSHYRTALLCASKAKHFSVIPFLHFAQRMNYCLSNSWTCLILPNVNILHRGASNRRSDRWKIGHFLTVNCCFFIFQKLFQLPSLFFNIRLNWTCSGLQCKSN